MTTVAIAARPQPAWRKLIGFNLLTGIVLAVIGWLIGDWLGGRIHAPSLDYFGTESGENDIGIMLGYLFGVIGFLIGPGLCELSDPAPDGPSRVPHRARVRGRGRDALLPPVH